MQEILKIEPKADTPGLIINPKENKFEIYGKSLPEDSNAFFDPAISFFRKYAENPNAETIFTFNFEYYNSASVRKIVNFIEILEQIQKKGFKVKAIWMFEETDEVMEDNVLDFQDTAEIPIELKSFKFDY